MSPPKQHPPKVLFVLGTRPEAIKLCPLIRLMHDQNRLRVRVCVTGQHRQMLDQVLRVFGVRPDHDLDVMRPGQTLADTTARILSALDAVLATEQPDLVVVQGDTTTTLCGALAAFYARVAVAHVEAGLRTGNMHAPWPEEGNRVLTSRLTAVHFAPTEQARQNLLAEGVPESSIIVTGNTGIDAVIEVDGMLERGDVRAQTLSGIDASRKLILVTAHRRESFGPGFERICLALQQLGARPDVQVVYPVHPNPQVRETVAARLSGQPGILLTDPLDYVEFVALMRRAYLLLTDSGGVQEEAPSLGKPVLVLRSTTERPEAVAAGTASLVGNDPVQIVEAASALLDNPVEYTRRSRIHNPYGDGHASRRIADHLNRYLADSSQTPGT